MLEIKQLADCGSSPKNTCIKDFNVAWTNGNMQALAEMKSVDVSWEIKTINKQ